MVLGSRFVISLILLFERQLNHDQFGEDRQESQFSKGMQATDAKFGVEDASTYGELTTKHQFDDCQTKDQESGMYIGKYPSHRGSYCSYYTDVVAAIKGEGEPKVKPEESRDGIRVIELARESAEKGVTMQFQFVNWQ